MAGACHWFSSREGKAGGKPAFSAREKEALKALSSVKDGEGKDVVYSGLVEGITADDAGSVKISLQLSKDYRQVKKQCQEVLQKLPWVTKGITTNIT